MSINKWIQLWKPVGIFQNRGVCGQAFPLLPHHPLLHWVFVLAPIYEWPECGKGLCMGTFPMRAIKVDVLNPLELCCCYAVPTRYRSWSLMFQIPVKVQDIPPLQYHPVKVGIADAFVIRRLDPRRNILYRFFYIYSIINITKDSVVNNAAVIFHPLLS